MFDSSKEAHEVMAETARILAGLMPPDDSQREFKVDGRPISGAVSLRLDFASPEDMMSWIRRNAGRAISSSTRAFAIDSLDNQADREVFVASTKSNKMPHQQLMVETTFAEEV